MAEFFSRIVWLLYQRRLTTSGQGMVEYGLILALVAVAVIVILGAVGTSIGAAFEFATTTMTGGDAD